MMRIILPFALIAISFLVVSADPQPDGGSPCKTYADCGGIDGGYCETLGNQSYCVCQSSRGNPDCAYMRTSRNLAGGLQFLCFAGIGGVGEFILGNNGIAVGQFMLLFAGLIVICIIGCIMCGCAVAGGDNGLAAGGVFSGIIYCFAILASLAGLVWNVIDGAFILQGKVTDSNGYSTY
jgi:hypothetical protein